jgi:hypothetical protein
MGIFTKLVTNVFTPKGVRLEDGEYIYISNIYKEEFTFSVRDNGQNVIIINTYSGTPDFLVYQGNGKYKNSFGGIFSFKKTGEGEYTGGLMGKDLGKAKRV